MNYQFVHRVASLAATVLIAAAPAWATCGGGGGGGDGGTSGKVFSVPWKKVASDYQPPKDGLAVYWFLNSPADQEKAVLTNSRALALYATQCIDLDIADAKSDLGQKFISGDTLPLVVLALPDGTAVSRADSKNGEIQVQQVVDMIAAELQKREMVLKAKLDSARDNAKNGNKDAAIVDFRSVYDQKCLFPRYGKEASKELKKLGVSELAAVPDAPNTSKAVSSKVETLMQKGLEAEEAENFSKALSLYEAAHKLDPADPCPLRFEGELYRHHIGNWEKATAVFQEILAMKADPLSRAVAMHGLGKMTIHNGEFIKGKNMMEQSLAIYPLAMTARNLAVYWNSESDRDQANKYTKLAQQLDPHDRFNLVFAAALFAGNGKPEEALKIAKENEDLMPASYNLAAIYAQNGQKDKALALLKRHFYEYERTKSVRSKEMMEARVDAVFASIVKDPAFLALTADADGKLPFTGMSRNKTATP